MVYAPARMWIGKVEPCLISVRVAEGVLSLPFLLRTEKSRTTRMHLSGKLSRWHLDRLCSTYSGKILVKVDPEP